MPSTYRVLMAAAMLVVPSIGPERLHADRPSPPDPSASVEGSSDLADRIAALIESLGDEQYVRREQAQRELARLGLEAFDALLEAQYHEDIEIASRARYLLRQMPVQWAEKEDSAEVRSLLTNYDRVSRSERLSRMAQLASMDDGQGLPALCRLMRFEIDRRLSKRAALLVMQQWPEDPADRAALARSIRQIVATSRRPAADWLLTYAASLEALEPTLADWARLVDRESEVLARFPEETDREIVRDMTRCYVQWLLQAGRREDAIQALRPTLALVEDDRRELLDTIDWALQHEAWFVAEDLAQRFPQVFQNDPRLLYRLAESQWRSGRKEQGETTAAMALQLDPGKPTRHIETAKELTDRLRYEWAEREYRLVIDQTEAGDTEHVEARLHFSNLLFDLQRENEAADVLVPAIEAAEQNPRVAESFGFAADHLRAMMHYRRAMYFSRQGDLERQRKELESAVRANPEDLDVLIAMYRLPDADDAWRKATVQRIEILAERLRDLARQYEEIVDKPVNQAMRTDLVSPLASLHNQYAWLISNTEGDFQEALRSSRRSLELRPNTAAYLDTLGRCYYALGDFRNAVKYQARAVRLEPSTQQIRRQLDLFQRALEQSSPSRDGATESP